MREERHSSRLLHGRTAVLPTGPGRRGRVQPLECRVQAQATPGALCVCASVRGAPDGKRPPAETSGAGAERASPLARGGDARNTHVLPRLNWPLPASLAAAFALARRAACFDLGGIAHVSLHEDCKGSLSQARICIREACYLRAQSAVAFARRFGQERSKRQG